MHLPSHEASKALLEVQELLDLESGMGGHETYSAVCSNMKIAILYAF